MEKLQKALQKAREQRTTAASAGTVGEHISLPESAEASAPDAAWESLDPFEPNRALLERNLLLSFEARPEATPWDILRTKVQLHVQKNGWTRLGITSPTSACGKTTMACNLALGLTRQPDIRVILVETDLRRPTIAKMLGYTPQHDTTEMLRGDIPLSEQAVRVRTNLAISMANQASSDPTSVLLSQRTHASLAEIERIYAPDLMIFDLPPVLVSDDTRAFLKEVDCALIVARAEATSSTQIDSCEREVAEQTNVLGVVLNQCRHTEDTDYGYHKYGYS